MRFNVVLPDSANPRTAIRDSFWTWRQSMYEFAKKITPEEQYAIARQLYIELLKHGYTSVGEFHYLHHKPSGAAYDQTDVMLDSVTRAAVDTGIAICALPVLYQRSGFRDLQPDELQRRFSMNDQQFFALSDEFQGRWAGEAKRVSRNGGTFLARRRCRGRGRADRGISASPS